jgi:UDP-N-acetylmuramoyl-tripeptide--D-alanyl-D-alanine ligase
VTAMVMTAADIARRCGGRVVGDAGARADSWAFDSRALDPGACFVALRDTRDGHDFVYAAFDAGARVALVDRELGSSRAVPTGHALVHVTDTLRALQDIGRSVRIDRADVRVVAVAGSTGKTSTKDLLAATLAPLGCHANAESHNNEFGLPLTLCNAPTSARVVVTEMGERFPGDLALLCDIARPQVAVVTNVGLAHAEHLGGFEGVANMLRGELLGALPAEGVAVLNGDDPWTAQLSAGARASVVTVGLGAHNDYRITDVELDGRLRPSFRLRGERLRVPLHGGHHVMNAAMAAAVAHDVFGMPFDEIAVALAGASTGKWRMELLETDDAITILNDAYNANPTSMEAALVALAHLPLPGRRIAVLGDMRELGPHHDEAHRAVGVRAAGLGLDVIIGVGAGGALIADTARTRGACVEFVEDAAAALECVDALVNRGDAVLCKASRAVGLEVVAEGLLAHRRSRADGSGAA